MPQKIMILVVKVLGLLLLGLLLLHYRAPLKDWGAAAWAAPRWWSTMQQIGRIDNNIRSLLQQVGNARKPLVFSLRQICTDEMTGIDKGVFHDAWRHELRLFCNGRLYGVNSRVEMLAGDKDNFAIISAGRDGLFLTEDDLVSRNDGHPVTQVYRRLDQSLADRAISDSRPVTPR